MLPQHLNFLDLNDADKLAHELEGSLGILKMLSKYIENEITPDEHTIRLLEMIILIVERIMDFRASSL